MPANNVETSYSSEPPIIEIHDRIAIIRYPRDGERAMSIRTLARAVERAEKALKRHAAGDDNIIVDD